MQRRARAFFCSLRSRRSRRCSSSSASAQPTRVSKPAQSHTAHKHAQTGATGPASGANALGWTGAASSRLRLCSSNLACTSSSELRSTRIDMPSARISARRASAPWPRRTPQVGARTLFAVDVVQVGDGVAHHLAALLAEEAGALLRVRVDQLLGAHTSAQLRNVVTLNAPFNAQRLAHNQAKAVVHLRAPCLIRRSFLCGRASVKPCALKRGASGVGLALGPACLGALALRSFRSILVLVPLAAHGVVHAGRGLRTPRQQTSARCNAQHTRTRRTRLLAHGVTAPRRPAAPIAVERSATAVSVRCFRSTAHIVTSRVLSPSSASLPALFAPGALASGGERLATPCARRAAAPRP